MAWREKLSVSLPELTVSCQQSGIVDNPARLRLGAKIRIKSSAVSAITACGCAMRCHESLHAEYLESLPIPYMVTKMCRSRILQQHSLISDKFCVMHTSCSIPRAEGLHSYVARPPRASWCGESHGVYRSLRSAVHLLWNPWLTSYGRFSGTVML